MQLVELRGHLGAGHGPFPSTPPVQCTLFDFCCHPCNPPRCTAAHQSQRPSCKSAAVHLHLNAVNTPGREHALPPAPGRPAPLPLPARRWWRRSCHFLGQRAFAGEAGGLNSSWCSGSVCLQTWAPAGLGEQSAGALKPLPPWLGMAGHGYNANSCCRLQMQYKEANSPSPVCPYPDGSG